MARKPDIRAAGALLWRSTDDGPEVLLVHRPRYDDWSIPKGKLKNRETLRDCAIREMKEESGTDVVLGAPLGWARYETPEGNWKEVRYWIATEIEKSSGVLGSREKVKRAPKSEIDKQRWFPIKAALKKVTSADDRNLIKRFAAMIDDGTAATVPFVVLRHAREKKRASWKKGEALRPLSTSGMARAHRVADVLSAYGVTQVASSTWERCMQTVSGYAKSIQQSIREIPELTEEAYAQDPIAVETFVDEAVHKLAEPTVVCVHRPTMQTILPTIQRYVPKKLTQQIPAKDPWLRAGEALVFHVVPRAKKAPRVVAIERVSP